MCILLVLPIKVPPQIMPFNFGDGVSNFEDSTATTCMISKGDQPLLIQWYLNDNPVHNDYHGIQIMQMGPKLSALRIDSLNDRHRGNYTCEVKNKAGLGRYSAELKINGDCLIELFKRCVNTDFRSLISTPSTTNTTTPSSTSNYAI